MGDNFPTMETPTPEAHRQKQEEILRRAAIEMATPEELESAIEYVRKGQEEQPNNPVLKDVLKQLEDKLEKKKPDTLH